MNFSVLISIYNKERPKYLSRALKSIWDDQILKPNEIVLVKDGPLSDDLETVIRNWSNRLKSKIKVVNINVNSGLGIALRTGLNECSHDIIARMDADDVSLPHRFSSQISYLNKNKHIELLGAHISEFNTTENETNNSRIVPLGHEKIIQKSKFLNPFNHPVVMFRKSSVLAAGNYIDLIGFEDYFLWVRMIKNGSQFANIDETLLLMRTNDMIRRRSGFKYAYNEWKFQSKILKLNHINYIEFTFNLISRIPLRVLSPVFIGFVYKYILRKKL